MPGRAPSTWEDEGKNVRSRAEQAGCGRLYHLAFNDKQPAEAVERYLGPRMCSTTRRRRTDPRRSSSSSPALPLSSRSYGSTPKRVVAEGDLRPQPTTTPCSERRGHGRIGLHWSHGVRRTLSLGGRIGERVRGFDQGRHDIELMVIAGRVQHDRILRDQAATADQVLLAHPTATTPSTSSGGNMACRLWSAPG